MIGVDRMTPLALAHLGEPAVRASALAIVVGLALAILRVRRASVRLCAWTIVLYAAIAMPALDWSLPGIPLAMPTAAPFHGWSRARPTDEPVAIATAASFSIPTQANAAGAESARVKTAGAASQLVQSTPPTTSVSWPVIGMSIYLICVALLVLRAVAGWLATTRVERRARLIGDSGLLTRARQHASALGMTRIPRLADADVLMVPMTTSVLRPMIVLPIAWHTWDAAKMDAVLAHELAHVVRRDLLTQRLSVLFRAVFCFSPLSWWLRRRLVDLAEQASDEAALEAGAERTAYAETLLEFFRDIQDEGHRARWHVAMAGGADAERRVERILAWKRGAAVSVTKSLVVTSVTASTFAVVLAASVTPVWRSDSPIAVTTPALQAAVEPAVPRFVPFSTLPATTVASAPSVAIAPEATTSRRDHAETVSPAETSGAGDVLQTPTSSALPTLPIVDAANGPVTTDLLVGRRMWMFLFDLSSMSSADVGRAAASATKWANEKMTDADVVLMASVDTQINLMLDFTSNKDKVLKALSRTSAMPTPLVGNWPAPDPASATGSTDMRLRAMRTICDALKPYQQKKTLLYFSVGVLPGGVDSRGDEGGLRGATSACSRANVAIDPIDVRGLAAIGRGGVSGGVKDGVGAGVDRGSASGVATGVPDVVTEPGAPMRPRPNFSGKWELPAVRDLNTKVTLLPARNVTGARTLMGILTGLCGARCEIVQDSRSVTVIGRLGHGDPISAAYVLDGVERKTALPSSGTDLGTEWTTKAGWVSDAIVITITEATKLRGGGERRVETTHVLAQTSAGLSIETTVTDTQGPKAIPIKMDYLRNE